MRSPTNYDRSVKEHNTTPLRGRDDVELVEADLVDIAIDELLDGCDGVFHLAAQPGFAAVSVRASPGAHAITSSQPSGSSRRRRGWGTGGLGLVVDLREHGALSDARGRAACADLALRGDEADVRAHRPRLYGFRRSRCIGDAVLHGLRSASTTRHGVHPDRDRPRCRGHVPGVRHRGAVPRRDLCRDAVSATIAAMERGVPGPADNVGGGSETSRARRSRSFEVLSGRALDVVVEPMATGDVRRAAADTSAAYAELDWAPQVSLEDGLRAQLDRVMRVERGDTVASADPHRAPVAER